MASLFTKILNREIPAEIVWENKNYAAFLSIEPISEGHTLVVPRQEIDNWLDLSPQDYLELSQAVHTVANLLRKAFKAKKVGQMISGFEVPHVHVHLVPANDLKDFPFPPVTQATPQELAQVAQNIRQFI